MKTGNSKIVFFTYAALLAFGLLWVGGAVLAPLLETAPSEGVKGSPFVSPVYYFYGHVCHQIAERSFSLAGQPLAVCARCLGIYVGGLAALMFYPLMRPLKRTDLLRRRWRRGFCRRYRLARLPLHSGANRYVYGVESEFRNLWKPYALYR